MSSENANFMGIDPETQSKMQESFWKSQIELIENINMRDLKLQDLPLARIKKIMKLDETVKMISAEVPILFAKAAELFIGEITMRGWWCTEENKRRTLQKSDIALAASRYDQFDFLIDIVPREEIKPSPKKQPMLPLSVTPNTQPQFQYYFQVPFMGSGNSNNLQQTSSIAQTPIIYNQHPMAAMQSVPNHPPGTILIQQGSPLLLGPNNGPQISVIQNQPQKQTYNINRSVQMPAPQTPVSYPLYLVSPSIAAGLVKTSNSAPAKHTHPSINGLATNVVQSASVLQTKGSLANESHSGVAPNLATVVSSKNPRKQIHYVQPSDKLSSIFGVSVSTSSIPQARAPKTGPTNANLVRPSTNSPSSFRLNETLLTPTKLAMVNSLSSQQVQKLDLSISATPTSNHTIQLTQQQLEALLGVRIHNLSATQPAGKPNQNRQDGGAGSNETAGGSDGSPSPALTTIDNRAQGRAGPK